MTVEENNVELLEYLGVQPMHTGAYHLPQFGYYTLSGMWKDSFKKDELKFHKDWKWLMTTLQSIVVSRSIKITMDVDDPIEVIYNKMMNMVKNLKALDL